MRVAGRAAFGIFLSLLLAIVGGVSPALSDGEDGGEGQLNIEREGKSGDRYIVVFKDNVRDVGQVSTSMTRSNPVALGRVYTESLKGFAGELTPDVVARLRDNPNVAYVERDLPVWAVGLPTGVDRIDADLNPLANIDGIDSANLQDGERVDVDVAVLDTGLDIGNPDLNIVGGSHFHNGIQDSNFDDDNGHGTHVGGTVGALDNNIGVVGVAPGARLWGVKVLDSVGNGFVSDIIAGVDWVTATRTNQDPNDDIEVINMSLGGIGSTIAFRTAVQNAVNQGVVVVVAAGNSQTDVFGQDGVFGTLDDAFPASYPEAAAISAMADFDGVPGGLTDQTIGFGSCTERDDDSFACFSNFSQTDHTGANQLVSSSGAAIDLIMPGVKIESTQNNGTTSFKSGTSMASPHAAGLAALYIAQFGRPTDASEVAALRQALIDTAMNQASGNRLTTLDEPESNQEPLGWAGPLSDTPPSATIVNPVDASIVSRTVTAQVNASDLQDATGSLNVEFSISGGSYSAMSYNSGSGFYEASWDSAASGDGTHTIDARATDSGANITNASQISVTVITNLTDVAITSVSPASISVTQSDSLDVSVEVTNQGNQTVASVDVSLDDLTDSVSIGSPQNVANLSPGNSVVLTFNLDTTGISFGSHVLEASHNLIDDIPSNDSAQTNVTVNSTSGSVTEDWTGSDGFAWPAQWSFDEASEAEIICLGHYRRKQWLSRPGRVTWTG